MSAVTATVPQAGPGWPSSLDLEAYFRRIDYWGPEEAGMEALEALHVRHQAAVPFENLDPIRGLPVRLDLPGLQAKLVTAGRGGYCFEHNSLFAAVLRALGFQVANLEARVRHPGTDHLRPRTHGVLRVDVEGRSWLVDVGFGGDGILGPVPLDGTVWERFGEQHRVAPEGPFRVLQAWDGAAWRDLYVFSLEPVHPIDWEVASHFAGTHPDSIFVRHLTVQIANPVCRLALRGRTLTETRAGLSKVRRLQDEEILPVIARRFKLRLPDGFVLPAGKLDWPLT